jgi:hypothetical protein
MNWEKFPLNNGSTKIRFPNDEMSKTDQRESIKEKRQREYHSNKNCQNI